MATWSWAPIYILVLIDLASHGHMVPDIYIYILVLVNVAIKIAYLVVPSKPPHSPGDR